MNLHFPIVALVVGIVLFQQSANLKGSVLANDYDPGDNDDDNGDHSINSDYTEQKQYTYEQIVNEMDKVTKEYLQDTILIRKLTPQSDLSDEFEPMRRRRRSVEVYVPEFIKNGVKLIQRIKKGEEKICADKGHIIDFSVTKFNGKDYITCLVKSKIDDRNFELYYGTLPFVENSIELKTLSNPVRLFAFPTIRTEKEVLLVVILNRKRNPNEVLFVWHHIDTNDRLTYQNNLKNIGRIEHHNADIWPIDNMIVLHDIDEKVLKMYEFINSYFDLQLSFEVGDDLSALCAFSYTGIRYLVLGYRNIDKVRLRPKDVVVMRYDREESKIEKIQSIQSIEDVVDIKFFSIGRSINQESFLVVVEQNFIIFYKLLKSKREFIIFQRIKLSNTRQVIPYGDSERTFVMAIVTQNYDIYLVNYNSLRFIYSRVNNRLRAMPNQHINIYKMGTDIDSSSVIRMLIGKQSAVEIHNIEFYQDKNMMTLWKDLLEWCTQKRKEVNDLERSTKLVQTKFSEAYYSNDPLVIRGTLSVPGYVGQVNTNDYRQRTDSDSAIVLNAQYFEELIKMEKSFIEIDKKINSAYQRLSDALLINSNEIQRISGKYSFENVRISQHNTVNYTDFPNLINFNILTNYLNGIDVKNLFAETIAIQRGNSIKPLQTMHFKSIDLTGSNQPLLLNVLVNNVYNLSDIVTSNSDRVITGKKRFRNCLLVDEMIASDRVNGKLFNNNFVLLNYGIQNVRNPVRMRTNIVRTNALDAKMVNNIDISSLLSNLVRKDEPTRITMPVEFTNGLKVQNLFIEPRGRLNGQNIDTLPDSVLWTNKPNQTVLGDFFFGNNVTIRGHLYVDRINNINIPEDLILTSNVNIIEGKKVFKDPVYIYGLNVTNDLNGLKVFDDGIPDILLKNWPQRIFGKKILHSLHVNNHSYVGGLMNGLSIQELDRQSKARPLIQRFDQIIVDNYAKFEAGLNFDQLNSLTRLQFDRLNRDSLRLHELWTNLKFDRVEFDELNLNLLDCDTINGLSLEHHLLTRNTNQTVIGPFAFHDVLLEHHTSVQSINNFSLSNLNNLFLNYGNQYVNGMKTFVGDIYAHSLRTPAINNIALDDIVFMDDGKTPSKLITGAKYFKLDNRLQFESLTVTNMEVHSINQVDMANMLTNSLRHKGVQNIPPHVSFKSMLIEEKEDFASLSINSVNLTQLWNDAVFSTGVTGPQRVTANKLFTGRVSFGDIEFEHSLDGVTEWEMKHNWMIQNMTQNVYANFSINDLDVDCIHIHDFTLSGIDLNWLDHNVVRQDRQTNIYGNLEFYGKTQVEGKIILRSKLNEISLDEIVLSDKYGIQTIRGKVELLNDVTVAQNLNVNGFVNGINVEWLCARAYRPKQGVPLVVNGNVRVFAPVHFNTINSISYNDLLHKTVRHDLQNQKITGKKIIDILVLNGPVQLNKQINNLNLENIFQNYMSLTKNQIVEAKINLMNNQVFESDLLVTGNFVTENGIIGGVNVVEINQHALRVYDDQQYEGNITFNAGLDIDLDLNTKYINNFEVDNLMHRKRQSNVFSEEVVFTKNLNVKDNVNVVKGKRISGAIIDKILNYAVLRDSNHNYTIVGSKTFDAIDVNIIHTKPLNDVEFSGQHLLLKSNDQNVNGEIHFDDELVVNTSLVVNTINDIQINQLNSRLVKKSKPNVIRTKVKIHQLDVNVVKVNALIDNVNITILNTISDRVKHMRSLETQANKTKRLFNNFDNQQSSISAKLLFYERYLTVREHNLKIDRMKKPLLVSLVNDCLYLFIPLEVETNGCHQIAVFSRQVSDIGWHRNHTLYSPGSTISIYQPSNDYFIIASHLFKSNPEHISKCISLNGQFNNHPRFPPKVGTVLVQVYRLITHSSLLFPVKYTSYGTTFPNVQSVSFLNDGNVVLARSGRELNILTENGPLLLPIFPGRITKVYSFKDTVLVETYNGINGIRSNQYEQHITRFVPISNQLIHLQRISLLGASNCLMIDSGLVDQTSLTEYRSYLLIAETNNHDRSVVHVYANPWNGTSYQKIQVIEENKQVERMESIQTSIHHNPYILMHKQDEIAIYRLLGMSGFRRYGQIRASEPIRSMFVAGNIGQQQHFLSLYFDNDCHLDSIYQDKVSYLEILKPRYRRKVITATQQRIRDLKFDDRESSQIISDSK